MRNRKIEIRVSSDELEKIAEKARVAGLTISAYMRQASLNRKIVPPIPEDVRRSISRWSANLNQLTKVANSTGKVQADAVEALRQEAREVLKHLLLLVRK